MPLLNFKNVNFEVYLLQLEGLLAQNKQDSVTIRSRALEFIEQMEPLQREVNLMRGSLGLECLPEIVDIDVFTKT